MADIARWLKVPSHTDDKYRRGVLGVRTGSEEYPGAAVLGVTAAWRTGIGMVRYVGSQTPTSAVLAARPETVPGEGRCDAWLIGSGTDPDKRSFAERETLTRLLRGSDPLIVDAGALDLALDLLRKGPAYRVSLAPMILTPHLGEFTALWNTLGLGDMPKPDKAAVRFAEELEVTVLLKGSTTFSASPTGAMIKHGPATPWLATAGTGDVLAGILGSLIASNADLVRETPTLLREIGVTAAMVHDTAARIAARAPLTAAGANTGRPITALDVAEAIPGAFAALK